MKIIYYSFQKQLKKIINKYKLPFNQKAKREITVTEFVVEMKLTYIWINADKPEEQLEIPFYAVGQQDDVSKAHGTGLTYAERYF